MSWKEFKSAVDSIFSPTSRTTKRRSVFRPAVVSLEERLVPTTYSTNFPNTENPISEGGHWINGATNGIDWGNVNTTPGYAVGVTGPTGFADATALLTGTWGPDQTAQATVRVGGAVSNYPEVELRLRSSISAHVNNGYEITESVAGAGHDYLIIVRWNGPLSDFTYLTVTNPGNYTGSYSVTTGDVVKATIVGNVISAYKNGILIGQATDNTYTSGSPGFGFNTGVNGDYGYTSYSASDGSTTTIPATPTGLTATAANAQVSLAWNASTGATSYNIYRSTSSGGKVKVNSTNGTSFTDTGVTNGTKYFYEVTAVNTAGESLKSSEVSATPTPLAETPFGGTPWAVPGTIQAENYDNGGEAVAYHDLDATNNGGAYRTSDGVDVQPTSDSGGGYNVGWIQAGEWLKYTVSVASTGSYDLSLRMANTGAGAALHVEVDGVNVSGSLSVPNTGGWQTWTTITKTGINLTAGQHIVKISFDTNGSNGWVGNLNWFSFASSATNQPPTVATPASASPNPVTGTTTALSVLGADDGGEANLTYTWATTGTPPAAVSFSGNGSNAAKNTTATFTKAGSYSFQVTIKDAGGLTVTSSVNVTVNQTQTSLLISPASATLADGATQQFSATAKDQFGNALSTQPAFVWSVDSGGLGSVSSGGLYTAPASGAGSAAVRATSGAVSGTANVTVTSTPPAETPFGGTPWAIPGTIQAENFDNGGEGIAYHDLDATNNGGAYRTSDGVDVQPTSDSGGGYNVGWIQAGEWLKYTVNVASTGSYDLSLRMANTGAGAALHVEVDGVNVSGSLGVPNTGGWQTWTTITKTGINLTAGQHIVKISFDTNGGNGWVGNLNWFSFAASATNQPPTVATAAAASANPVSGTTTNVSVLGADDGGEANLTYTWATTGTPPAAVSFSANATNAAKNTTATFTKAGSYSFQVTIRDAGGLTVTSSVNVTVNQTLTSIGVAPASATLADGATQQFSATAKDQFGNALSTQPAFSWSVDSGGLGSVSSGGLYTAPASGAGSATVRATSGAVSSTASVTVTSTARPWAHVQTNAANSSNASTSVTLASPATAGDTVVVEVSWSTGPAFSSLTDNQGNTYVQIGTEQRSTSFGISSRLYYAKNVKGGALTVTSLLSGTAAYHETYVHEYSGLDPNNPLDGFSVNVGSGSSFTSNSVTTTGANDLLYGIDIDSASGSAASGWTARSNFDGNVAADKNAATAGSYAFTGNSSGSFIVWVAAFKLANPEMLAGTPLVGSQAPGLTLQQLDPVIALAIADWAVTGLSAMQIATLKQARFVITDLPGGLLGDTAGNTIYIDTNAAGYGWSLGSRVSPHKVDLLTVVAHELGHELCLSDLNTQSNPGNVMDDTLGTGVRRLPGGSSGYAADSSSLDIQWMGQEWTGKASRK